MSNYLTLTRKGNKDPSHFHTVDADLCNHFGVEVHPTRYLAGWYDVIGFKLAFGKTFADIISELTEQATDPSADPETTEYYSTLVSIAEYLEANYTADSWATIGR